MHCCLKVALARQLHYVPWDPRPYSRLIFSKQQELPLKLLCLPNRALCWSGLGLLRPDYYNLLADDLFGGLNFLRHPCSLSEAVDRRWRAYICLLHNLHVLHEPIADLYRLAVLGPAAEVTEIQQLRKHQATGRNARGPSNRQEKA